MLSESSGRRQASSPRRLRRSAEPRREAVGGEEYAPDVVVGFLREDFGDGAGEPGAVSEDRASPPREKGAEKREKSEIVPVHGASRALE